MLVEGDEKALMMMAAYIDLNPVRAGMVAKPEDYRWCGYASAIGGNRWARLGLGKILSNSHQVSGEDFEGKWDETSQVYRLWLYHEGEERILDEGEVDGVSRQKKRGFSKEEVEDEHARKGRMTIRAAIRCRVRYLTEGAVLGSENFVNQVFARNRSQFGKRRETGARRMREADWGELCVLRDLREKVVIPSRR